jgi:hypothetical protein
MDFISKNAKSIAVSFGYKQPPLSLWKRGLFFIKEKNCGGRLMNVTTKAHHSLIVLTTNSINPNLLGAGCNLN